MPTSTTAPGSQAATADEFASTIREQATASIEQGQQLAGMVRDQTVASIKQGQRFALDGITVWADSIRKVTTRVPGLPGVDGLRQSVEASFDIALELLETQRALVLSVVNAVAPAA